ncbi:zinc finger CCCH domain-containing protein 61-like [Nicotiana tabacum]|uniref:Zinc finger CCCH domain-containing protein 61-like n=2 Tax=Nicotiana TaxID=4085 RepID=A0A1S4BLZ5_TOBAC|nr:PREDICTED: zinc finger CCCH domain-containing protein 61-like [Nicotiana sylvestris]XP_016489908.1 PREDICTED: zinc finger CCCH domain-containing protein 61-like [Nicotiana tabacum]
MEGLCAEQHHHKFHPSHQLYLNKKSLRDIDIPPRKLLSRRSNLSADPVSDMFMDSPKSDSDTLFQKFLPYNSLDEDDSDPYSSDHFRMYEFKVRRCTRSRSHDWTDCPFAHPGEKARRRDPRRFHYSGTVCSEFRKGNCSRGDNCEFAHGVFECWLHPTRYRTEACKDGKNCKRKVCFFAHTPRQLRVLPPSCHESSGPGSSPRNSPVEKKYRNLNHCCMFCHSVSASPTSTLMGMSHMSPPMSPSLSPPLSPAKTQFSSPMSRYSDRFGSVESSCGMGQLDHAGLMSYKDALTELVSSLEAMNVNANHEANSSSSSAAAAAVNNFDGKLPWLDVSFNNNNINNYDDQHQFLLSPYSTPSPSPVSSSRTKFYTRDFPSPSPVSSSGLSFSPVSSSNMSFVEDTKNNATNRYYNENGLGGPDFGWVNDLLT